MKIKYLLILVVIKMIHSYNELYLENAMNSMGCMVEFAVYDLNLSLVDFFDSFLSSDISSMFEMGDASIIAGKSGIELAYDVLEIDDRIDPTLKVERTPEYWVGFVLAYFQWSTNIRFKELLSKLSIDEIVNLYNPYHEMDINQTRDRLLLMYKNGTKSKGTCRRNWYSY